MGTSSPQHGAGPALGSAITDGALGLHWQRGPHLHPAASPVLSSQIHSVRKTALQSRFQGRDPGLLSPSSYFAGRRSAPLSVHLGIGAEEHDQEGRVLTAEYENLFVVNVYVPNAGVADAPRP